MRLRKAAVTTRLRHLIILVAVPASGLFILATPASAAPKPTEAFVSTQDINVPGGTVFATGLINDTGQDVVLSPTEDRFDFPDGSITVFHSPTHSTNKFSDKKCSFSFTERGTYVFGNGTDVWAGFSGSGTYVASGSAVDACTGPGVGTLTISASGSIVASSGP
jgi:hypothetical protein